MASQQFRRVVIHATEDHGCIVKQGPVVRQRETQRVVIGDQDDVELQSVIFEAVFLSEQFEVGRRVTLLGAHVLHVQVQARDIGEDRVHARQDAVAPRRLVVGMQN